MKNIAITFSLRTPILNAPTLDALLARIRFDQTGDLELAHNDLPLVRSPSGLWHASSAYLTNRHNVLPVSFIASLRQEDVRLEEVQPNNKNKDNVLWDPGRKRDCGNVRNQYEATIASHLWYFCQTTDEAELIKMIKIITNIGKKNNRGYGEIIEMQSQVSSVNGIVDHDGKPMRPVPVTLAEEFGIKADSIRAEHAWHPPYWRPEHRTECFVPDTTRSWTTDDIEEAFL